MQAGLGWQPSTHQHPRLMLPRRLVFAMQTHLCHQLSALALHKPARCCEESGSPDWVATHGTAYRQQVSQWSAKSLLVSSPSTLAEYEAFVNSFNSRLLTYPEDAYDTFLGSSAQLRATIKFCMGFPPDLHRCFSIYASYGTLCDVMGQQSAGRNGILRVAGAHPAGHGSGGRPRLSFRTPGTSPTTSRVPFQPCSATIAPSISCRCICRVCSGPSQKDALNLKALHRKSV